MVTGKTITSYAKPGNHFTVTEIGNEYVAMECDSNGDVVETCYFVVANVTARFVDNKGNKRVSK